MYFPMNELNKFLTFIVSVKRACRNKHVYVVCHAWMTIINCLFYAVDRFKDVLLESIEKLVVALLSTTDLHSTIYYRLPVFQWHFVWRREVLSLCLLWE